MTETRLKSLVVKGQGDLMEPSAEAREDATVAARSTGTSEQAALKVMSLAEAAGPVMSVIAADNPKTFVESGTTTFNEEGDRYLVFTEEPSNEVVRLLATMPFDTLIYFGAAAPQTELEELQVAAGATLLEQTTPELNLRVSVDRLGSGLTITYGGQDLSEAAEGQVVAVAAGEDQTLPVPIRFIRDDELKGLTYQVDVRGGDMISVSNTPCTSGFTGRNTTTDNKGVVSARHCPNGTAQYGPNLSLGVIDWGRNADTVTAPSGQTAWVDLQFWKTQSPHDTTKKFRATNSQERTVSAVSDPAVSDLVCHYGVGTQSSCGDVTDAGMCATFSGQLTCRIVEVDNADCAGGDSGGPWFDGTVAAGIHTGGGGGYCYFTKISAASSNMDIHILRN